MLPTSTILVAAWLSVNHLTCDPSRLDFQPFEGVRFSDPPPKEVMIRQVGVRGRVRVRLRVGLRVGLRVVSQRNSILLC